MKRCLIVFAKEPKKGRVKTRLHGYLPKTQCVNLYKSFLRDALELVNKVSCEYKILSYESYGKTPRYLKRIASRCIFYKQEGNGLGERMYNAGKFAQDSVALLEKRYDTDDVAGLFRINKDLNKSCNGGIASQTRKY